MKENFGISKVHWVQVRIEWVQEAKAPTRSYKMFPLSTVNCFILCSFLSNPKFELFAIDGW